MTADYFGVQRSELVRSWQILLQNDFGCAEKQS